MKPKYLSKKDGKGKGAEGSTNINGKQKDFRGSHSSEFKERDEVDFGFPVLKTVDKSRHLHYYSTILSRKKEDGVGMEDIDRLQSELELMLSATEIRLRTLQTVISNMNLAEGSGTEKSSLVMGAKKRKLSDVRTTKSIKDLSKVQKLEVTTKMDGISSGNETDSSNEVVVADVQQSDANNGVLPKKNIQNKFWASVEPYLGEITEENLKDLEELIESCNSHIEGTKIPPLGPHYTESWAEEDLRQEKLVSAVKQMKNNSASEPDINLLKRASTMCNDRSPGPLVQRLVSALMEEPSRDSFSSKLTDENDTAMYLGKLPLYHTTACFEKRIRKELEAVGLLEIENDDTDEILSEIRKCDEELKIVSSQNRDHLVLILEQARQEVRRQEIKNKIKTVDSEIIEIYKKIAAAKLKKKRLRREVQEQAWKLLKDRENILKSLEAV